MIKVSLPVIVELEEKTRMTVDVHVDGEKNEIWFETDKEYGKYFCTERSDALLVLLFYYAMKNGHDMEFDGEITEELYFGVQHNLIKALHYAAPEFYESKVICKTAKAPLISENKSATGVSGGVDSLSSIYLYTRDECPDSYKLDYITYFNSGAAHYPDGTKVHGENGEDVDVFRLKNAHDISKATGCPLIIIDSNINEFLKIDFTRTHTFRNCGFAMLLQKLLSKYYYASNGLGFDETEVSPKSDTSFYDCVSLHYISNGIIKFYSSLDYCYRKDKTAMLADYEVAQKFLNVCILEGENCGVCKKCRRTVTTLDALGKLDKFSESFDVEKYRNDIKSHYTWVVMNRKTHFFDEIYSMLKKQKKIPFSSVVKGNVLRIIRDIKRKL